MPKGRNLSTGSGSGATEGAVKNSNGIGGGVLSKVLGSFRRPSHDSDVAANDKEDTDWTKTYKITHRPDRPLRDKRERLRNRNTEYVLGELHKMWQWSEQIQAEKRERGARAKAVAAGFARSRSQDRRNRHDEPELEPGRRSDSNENSAGRGSRLRGPSLQTSGLSSVPNFSHSRRSPKFDRKEWLANSEEQYHHSSSHHIPANDSGKDKERHGRSISSPISSLSSSPASSDRMTIQIFRSESIGHGLGLDLQDPTDGEGEFGGFRTDAGGAEVGGHSRANYYTTSASSPTPPSAPKSFTHSPTPSWLASPFPSSAQKEIGTRRRQKRTSPSRSPQRPKAKPLPRVDAVPELSAREKARRESATSLYIDADQVSTPSLILNSSPVSGRVSPLTPIENASDNERVHRETPSTGSRPYKTCPMPLCGKPLLTAVDQQQNLCAECRQELQPRQSTFAADILNPFSSPYLSSNTYADSYTSLLSDTQYDSTAEIALAQAKTVRNINGERKARIENHDGGDCSVDTVRVTEILPTSPRKKNSNNNLSSRFNRARGEFKLQPVPPSRKHARGQQQAQLRSSPGSQQIPKQKSASPLRDENNRSGSSNHVGFQLVGWQTPTPSPAPRPFPHRPPDSRPRDVSGPLLEPKTFRPATPRTGQSKDSPITRRRLSGSRPRARRVSLTNSDGLAWSLSRACLETAGVPRSNTPTPHGTNSAQSGSPGHSRNRHQPTLHHPEQRAIGLGISVHAEPPVSATNTPEAYRSNQMAERVVEDEDIYREIESIIDCYLRIPDAPESENEKRKAEAVASYFTALPLEVEMRNKGFI